MYVFMLNPHVLPHFASLLTTFSMAKGADASQPQIACAQCSVYLLHVKALQYLSTCQAAPPHGACCMSSHCTVCLFGLLSFGDRKQEIDQASTCPASPDLAFDHWRIRRNGKATNTVSLHEHCYT